MTRQNFNYDAGGDMHVPISGYVLKNVLLTFASERAGSPLWVVNTVKFPVQRAETDNARLDRLPNCVILVR